MTPKNTQLSVELDRILQTAFSVGYDVARAGLDPDYDIKDVSYKPNKELSELIALIDTLINEAVDDSLKKLQTEFLKYTWGAYDPYTILAEHRRVNAATLTKGAKDEKEN